MHGTAHVCASEIASSAQPLDAVSAVFVFANNPADMRALITHFAKYPPLNCVCGLSRRRPPPLFPHAPNNKWLCIIYTKANIHRRHRRRRFLAVCAMQADADDDRVGLRPYSFRNALRRRQVET